MKVGDKVFVEVEDKRIDESVNEFIGLANDGSGYWFKNEAITQLPIQEGRWMMVSLNKGNWHKRFVIGKVDELFVTFDTYVGFKRWKYAKEIPTKRKLTMQEIAEKFGEDLENIEICQ